MSEPTTKAEFQCYLEQEVLTSIYPSPNAQEIKTKGKRPFKPTLQNAQRISLITQPTEGNLESVINAIDGRRQVQNPAKWPNSVHGVVVVRFEGVEGTCSGSGTLIGPNIVLTAGHNLYSQRHGTFAQLESVQFLPGMEGQTAPFGVIKVEKYFVSPNYVKENREDYGILVLKEPIGEVTGYFGLVCPESEELAERMINVTGYPRDKVKTRPKCYDMWGMEGHATYVDRHQGLIHYAIDTAGGQSGSGVWYREDEDFYVCGIHVNGCSAYNQATLLTKSIYNQIHAWLQQIMTKKFFLSLGDTKEIQFKNLRINADCVSVLSTYNLVDLVHIDLAHQKIGVKGLRALVQNNWRNLSQLLLSNNDIDAEGAVVLGQNNSWKNLALLDLNSNKIGARGALALAQNTSWVNLSYLYLSGNDIGTEGVAALAQNISWINLYELDLSWNKIDAKGAARLAQSNSWIYLLHLDLSNNIICAEGAAALARNSSWMKLKHLDLSRNAIGSEGATGLARNSSWAKLEHLDLSWNKINSHGVAVLAQNNTWIQLKHLDLSSNEISARGARNLAQNQSWRNLASLHLHGNGIGPKGAAELAQNISWENLTHLDLSGNGIGPEGAAMLALNTSWAKLSCLYLSSNDIDADGATMLAQNTSWGGLSKLDLSWNEIGEEGAMALAKSISWLNLAHLGLFNNNVGRDGVEALTENPCWTNISIHS